MTQKTQKITKRQKDFIEIFKKKLCLITAACEAANVARKTYYRWLDIPAFQEAVEDARVGLKDFGEAALFKLIDSGNPAGIIFFNKCRNKDRGYIERSELDLGGQIKTSGGSAKFANELFEEFYGKSREKDVEKSLEGEEC